MIRLLETSDIPTMVNAFAASNWTQKPAKLFQHHKAKRDTHFLSVRTPWYGSILGARCRLGSNLWIAQS
jgi:hypothetical protein